MPGPYFLCVLRQHYYCQMVCIEPCEGIINQRVLALEGQGSFRNVLLVCYCSRKEKRVLSQPASLAFMLRTQRKIGLLLQISVLFTYQKLNQLNIFFSGVCGQILSSRSSAELRRILTSPNSLREARWHAEQILRGLEKRMAEHSGSGD